MASRYHKRRYAPLYRSIRTPGPTVGVGPNDGIFTRLHARATIRYTEQTVGTALRTSLPIPVNFLEFDPVGLSFNAFPNVDTATSPAPGAFTFVDYPIITGWEDSLRSFVTYRISGVAISMRFYTPFNDVQPVIYKMGILAERDFGTATLSYPHGTTVTSVVGGASWYVAHSGILVNSATWNNLNQKAWRYSTSQPGTQRYVTLSTYIDAAKLLHWDRSYYKAQSSVQGGITANSTTGLVATVTQPSTRCAAQLAFEIRSATDGTPLTNLPNFMFDLSLTYFVRAVDPHTLQNMTTN